MLNDFGCRKAVIVFILLMMFAAGCTTTASVKMPQPVAPPPEIAAAEGWWYARFQLRWPQEEPVSWHWDLLIANEIIAPVMESSRANIRLWRFHRRAARDEAGHQFSFIFYASAQTADQVYL